MLCPAGREAVKTEQREREALEGLARRMYLAYRALPGAPADRVEPETLARELLGLRVEYRRLSRDGSVLGLTAAGPVGVPVAEGGGFVYYYLDGNTILLDSAFLSPWANGGRRRFTLMHEVSHQLLARRSGRREASRLLRGGEDSPGERRANALAAALLMPVPLLRRSLALYGLTGCPAVPDRRLDPETWRRCAALAEALGVSRRALDLRLRSLRPAGGRRCLFTGVPGDVAMDENDFRKLESRGDRGGRCICRNTT